MRRIINSTFITLDGLTEELPKWHFEYHDESASRLALEELKASDALLMGRATYDVYAAVWPARDDGYADIINAMHKYVVSSTLESPEWNNTSVISSDVVEQVRALKERDGRDILMHGFGPVVRELLAAGLLDELHLWVHPVLAGFGEPEQRIHRDGLSARLKLDGTQTLDSGVVVLTHLAA